ncbi:hypothetical protein MKL09_07135 [Methylobacterium sp. J-048]|uniref:hypothetical protein n=1 Tax=Methylobacterium sp. J-048 TaxID=2836635 RepID=UPI001FBA6D5F|nr:hypothetical protein [Methylobacterium sp. J-048]MCJ2056321.1 hypothetical protein [Methylobacterium sp. J-048]
MQLPFRYLDSVAFIFCRAPEGLRPIGTGFFIELVDAYDGAAIMSNYFVTARHVIENATSKLGAQSIVIRVNELRDGVKEVELPVSEFFQSLREGSADVTIARYSTPSALSGIAPVALWKEPIFADMNIGIGSKTLTVGLFHRIINKNRNVPIVRTGSIAAMPFEPIDTGYGDATMYIIEARSIGGLSGAPVFVEIPGWEKPKTFTGVTENYFGGVPGRTPGLAFETKIEMTSTYKLIGLTHGHWDARLSAQPSGRYEVSREDLERINEGLSLVTPVARVRELLEEDHMREELETYAKKYLETFKNRGK